MHVLENNDEKLSPEWEHSSVQMQKALQIKENLKILKLQMRRS